MIGLISLEDVLNWINVFSPTDQNQGYKQHSFFKIYIQWNLEIYILSWDL